jgi:hypothetical protein
MSSLFFWCLVAVTVVAFAVTGYLFLFDYRPSELAPDVNVKRFGRGARYASLTLSVFLIVTVAFMLTIYAGSIFSSVRTEANESSIWTEDHQRIESSRIVHVVIIGGETFPLVFRDDNVVDGGLSTPHTISFDIVKRDRFKWVKIEKMSIRSISYAPIPNEIAREQLRTQMILRPATEFKVVVWKDATEKSPTVYDGALIGSPRPTVRGSLVIDSDLPMTVFVDVYFEREGIYEIVPEVTIKDDGWWKRDPIQSTRPMKIACMTREKKKEMPKGEKIEGPRK